MRGLTYAAGEILVFMLAATLVGYVLGRLRARSRLVDRAGDEEPETFELTPVAWSEIIPVDVALESDTDNPVDDAESAPAVLSPLAALPLGGDETPTAPADDGGEQVAALVSEVDRQKDMIERLERVVEETQEASAVLADRDARIVDLETALTMFGEPVPAMPAYTSASSGTGAYADLHIDIEIRV